MTANGQVDWSRGRTVLLEVLLAGGDELDSGKLESRMDYYQPQRLLGCLVGNEEPSFLPAGLEAGDDGANKSALR